MPAGPAASKESASVCAADFFTESNAASGAEAHLLPAAFVRAEALTHNSTIAAHFRDGRLAISDEENPEEREEDFSIGARRIGGADFFEILGDESRTFRFLLD